MAEKLTYEELEQRVKALIESEKLHRLILENVTDVIWILDMEMKVTYFSPSVTQMRGYSVKEAMAQSVEEAMTPASFESAMKMIAEELELHNKRERDPARSRKIEAELICKDGSTVWTEIEANFIYNSEGQPTGILGITRNITERKKFEKERKQAEAVLRASEEKYRLLVKNITSVVYKGYKDWSVEFFDKKIEFIVGYSADDFNSKRMKWNDIIVEEDIETAREIFINALKTDKSYVREYRIKSKAGDIQWIQERGSIVCDNKGEIDFVSGVFFNITARKRTEEEREKLIHELQNALAEIKTLSGLLPICSHCKKICDDKGCWNQIESYIHKHSDTEFSHGICPECAKKYYPDYNLYDE